VPGDVGAVVNTMWAMRAYGDCLLEAGTGLARITTTDGWSGPAADQFRGRFHGEPARWTQAGRSFHAAADAMDAYATTLRHTQQQAASAIALWEHLDHDPAARASAQRVLGAARAERDAAADAALRSVSAARDAAPAKPGMWSTVDSVGRLFGDVMLAGTATLANGVASAGNAMIQHPGDALTALGGVGLIAAGAGGDGLGAVLDATGVGAIGGVPLNAVSTAGVITGIGMVGAATVDLTGHATTDSRMTVMDRSGAPDGRAIGRSGTKTDRMKEQIDQPTLDAARRELNGEVVSTKPTGEPYDHLDKVRNAQRGLVSRIVELKRQLADARIADADKPALQAELAEASQLLDYTEQFAPRA
jgi:hypothetical protein